MNKGRTMKPKKLSCAEKLKAWARELRRLGTRDGLDTVTLDAIDGIVQAITTSQPTAKFDQELVTFVRGIEAGYVRLGYK